MTEPPVAENPGSPPPALRPLCFVLMPFGLKPAPGMASIDFNAVYRELIAPAIWDAGLEPIRADEEVTGGIVRPAPSRRSTSSSTGRSCTRCRQPASQPTATPSRASFLPASSPPATHRSTALNRTGRGAEAERVLLGLIAERGPGSETYGSSAGCTRTGRTRR